MTTTSTIPGTGLSYTELCAEPNGSEARLMWRALGAFADVLGVSTVAPQIGSRTKTIDELLVEIREIVPAGLDIAAAAKATLSLTPDPPAWTETYEIHRLTTSDGEPGVMRWVIHERPFDHYDLAREASKDYEDRTGGIFAVVRVQTNTTVEVYPKNYTPRR